MAYGVFLSRSWKSQPNGFVTVDWKNPLTKSLRFADTLMPGSRDAVTGAQAVRSGTVPRITQYGIGPKIGLVSTDSITTNIIDTTITRTYAFRVRRDGPGGGNLGRLFEKRATGTSAEQLFWENSTGKVNYQLIKTGGTVTWADVPSNSSWSTTAAPWRRMALTIDTSSTSNSPVFYRDGDALGAFSVATATGTWVPSTEALVIGNRPSDSLRNWDGIIQDFVVWDRVLSEDEVAEYDAAPYQIYRLDRPVIYSFASASAPTLSAATVTAITASGAKPRVTVTF